PSTTAREAVVADERSRRRDEVLRLMGLDGVIRPDGRFTGQMTDMAELPKWDALGLTRAEQDGKIREMLDKQRAKVPGFFPNRWSWFTAGMGELAAAKRQDPASAQPRSKPNGPLADPNAEAERQALVTELGALRGSNSDAAFARRREIASRLQALEAAAAAGA
ncbi:hypothetical protein O4J55_10385, partial [Paracoccus sp. PXZ]